MTTAIPSRARRSGADRPPPDWDLVYRRNSIERLKRDRPGLDVRDELPSLIERGYEDIPEEEVVRLYWWGLAHDKPKIGTFMVRIKCPAVWCGPTRCGRWGASPVSTAATRPS